MKLTFCTAFACLGFIAPGLMAQTAASPGNTLPEVVVTDKHATDAVPRSASTGSKTDTPLKDLPASVIVILEKLMKEQGGTGLDDTIRNVSGLTQSSSGNYGFFNNYLSRGLSLDFLRDGVPDGARINGYSRSLLNVQQVEVLKGPGSALYGSSSPGGTINLVTAPPLSRGQYSISQVAGSFDTYQSSIDFTGPLGAEGVSYRLRSAYHTSSGYRGLEQERIEVLPVLQWKLNKDQTLTFDFDYRDLDLTSDTSGIPFRGRTLLSVTPDHRYYTPFATTEQRILRGSIRHEYHYSPDLTLRNNLVVLKRDLYLLRNAGGAVAPNSIVMTGRNLRSQRDDASDLIYQLEPVWKIETGGIEQTLLGGFEFQHHSADARRETAALSNIRNVFDPIIPETSIAALNFRPNFDRSLEANYFSLYAQDQVDFDEHWKVRIGGRIDRFETYDYNRIGSLDRRRFDTELSGQFGLVYQPIQATSFYSGISQGAQAILNTETGNSALPPENSTQYELGNKTTFLDGRISLNTALFRVIRENFLVTIGPDQVPVGEQQTQGIEFDLQSEPLRGWKLFGNYALYEAEITRLPSTPSVEGNRPTGVPVQTASAWTTYEIQTGILKGLGCGGGTTFRDEVFLDQANTQGIPSYVTGDVVVFYRQGPVELQVNLRNVTDETWYRNGVNSGALPGTPLTIEGTARLTF
ncbi:MAG: TonB-dependent siderophore receptor [Verrucomicrobiae bacterium]|nr:TonB-dependent siderophore receptor [Verrucomicrobiae bacterium]